MVTEDYVSLETAKLLKEKGFNEKAKSYFTDGGLEGYMFGTGQKSNSELEDCFYSRPTLQMAMKWLREVHNLHCSVDYDYVLGWYCQITSLKETVEYDYEEMKHYHPEKDNGFSSPEEACEAGIRYCLERLV